MFLFLSARRTIFTGGFPITSVRDLSGLRRRRLPDRLTPGIYLHQIKGSTSCLRFFLTGGSSDQSSIIARESPHCVRSLSVWRRIPALSMHDIGCCSMTARTQATV